MVERSRKMQHLSLCVLSTVSQRLRGGKCAQPYANNKRGQNGQKNEKYNYDKIHAHTSISKRRVYNEKCHQILLSFSPSHFLSLWLSCLFWCRAQPPVAYVIIEQTKINILHAKYHSGIPTFVIFRCTWLLQCIAMCAAMWR